jgi:hypothetical protein
MDGLEERLLSSMSEKSFAMSIFQKVKKSMPRRHGVSIVGLSVRQIYDVPGTTVNPLGLLWLGRGSGNTVPQKLPDWRIGFRKKLYGVC